MWQTQQFIGNITTVAVADQKKAAYFLLAVISNSCYFAYKLSWPQHYQKGLWNVRIWLKFCTIGPWIDYGWPYVAKFNIFIFMFNIFIFIFNLLYFCSIFSYFSSICYIQYFHIFVRSPIFYSIFHFFIQCLNFYSMFIFIFNNFIFSFNKFSAKVEWIFSLQKNHVTTFFALVTWYNLSFFIRNMRDLQKRKLCCLWALKIWYFSWFSQV